MRTASACLLSLLLTAAVALAAPAPLPKVDRNPPPATNDQAVVFLRDTHGLVVERIQAHGRTQWIAIAQQPRYYYSRRALYDDEAFGRVVYLVKYAGKDHQDRPQFTVAEVARGKRGQAYP